MNTLLYINFFVHFPSVLFSIRILLFSYCSSYKWMIQLQMYLSVAVKTDEEFYRSSVVGNEVLDGQRLGVRQGRGAAVVLVTSVARGVTFGVEKFSQNDEKG